MSKYVNGLNLSINDTVRIGFKDQTPDGKIEDVADLSMNYSTLKMLHDTIGKSIADYDAKLSDIAEKAKHIN